VAGDGTSGGGNIGKNGKAITGLFMKKSGCD